MLNDLFVLKIFTFLFRLFGYVLKRLDKKASQTRQQIIAQYTYCPKSQKTNAIRQ